MNVYVNRFAANVNELREVAWFSCMFTCLFTGIRPVDYDSNFEPCRLIDISTLRFYISIVNVVVGVQ